MCDNNNNYNGIQGGIQSKTFPNGRHGPILSFANQQKGAPIVEMIMFNKDIRLIKI